MVNENSREGKYWFFFTDFLICWNVHWLSDDIFRILDTLLNFRSFSWFLKGWSVCVLDSCFYDNLGPSATRWAFVSFQWHKNWEPERDCSHSPGLRHHHADLLASLLGILRSTGLSRWVESRSGIPRQEIESATRSRILDNHRKKKNEAIRLQNELWEASWLATACLSLDVCHLRGRDPCSSPLLQKPMVVVVGIPARFSRICRRILGMLKVVMDFSPNGESLLPSTGNQWHILWFDQVWAVPEIYIIHLHQVTSVEF